MGNPKQSETAKIDPRYSCFKLKVGRSKIQGRGVYAGQRIPPGRKVIEYTGERVPQEDEKRLEESLYLFILNKKWMIDGAVGGSGAELINHSCCPNLATRILKGHILYFSRRWIEKGEELTIDYNYDDTDDTMICRCGSKQCRGTINIK
ncbi:MAG TPA: SET domain-containing protein-lysine N-methyltransferase [Terriglobia bacterium]|nr:SET domain-containing protein-lysine N-methyltransferase [Terriglobia bacterium]